MNRPSKASTTTSQISLTVRGFAFRSSIVICSVATYESQMAGDSPPLTAPSLTVGFLNTNVRILFLLRDFHLGLEHYGRGTRDATIFSDPPEMHSHEN